MNDIYCLILKASKQVLQANQDLSKHAEAMHLRTQLNNAQITSVQVFCNPRYSRNRTTLIKESKPSKKTRNSNSR